MEMLTLPPLYQYKQSANLICGHWTTLNEAVSTQQSGYISIIVVISILILTLLMDLEKYFSHKRM